MPGNYVITTRADGEGINAVKYMADHQQHVDNLEPPKVDDYSTSVTEMRSTVDPGEVGSESQATSLAGELERIRFAIKEMKGTAQWYETAAANLSALFPPGASVDYWGATAPVGWVLASGRTIGDAASGATERAHADTATLFGILWNSIANSELPIQDSAGAPSTRGASAATDFAAHKRLPVPDRRGRGSAGLDNMGGTAANRLTSASSIAGTTLGASGGTETITLTTNEMPAHGHSVSDPGHQHDLPIGTTTPGSGSLFYPGTLQIATERTTAVATGIAIGSTGGNGAHGNVAPVLLANVIIKL